MATIEALAAQVNELMEGQRALLSQRSATAPAQQGLARVPISSATRPAVGEVKGLSTPTIVCIAFIVLVVVVVGIGIVCFSCSGESQWSEGIARYLGGKSRRTTAQPKRLAVRPSARQPAKAPVNAPAVAAEARTKHALAAAARAKAVAGAKAAKAAGAGAKAAGAGAKAAGAGAKAVAGAGAGAGAKKPFMQTLPAAPAGSRLLSQRLGGKGISGGRSLSGTQSVRSQRLATAIADAKRPKKKALVGTAVRAAAVVTGTAGGQSVGTGFKGVQTGAVKMGSIGALGAGRLARTETQESRETIMKQGRGSRLTKEQIKDGILLAHKRGRDPSRAVRLVTTRRTAVDQEAWRAPANPKTKRTFTIPCGANPPLAFYDAMMASQLAEAAEAR